MTDEELRTKAQMLEALGCGICEIARELGVSIDRVKELLK